MLIDKVVPAVPLLNTVCATTPTPKTISTNVPRNSASSSRPSPFDINASWKAGGHCRLIRHGLHSRARSGHHELARHRLRPRRHDSQPSRRKSSGRFFRKRDGSSTMRRKSGHRKSASRSRRSDGPVSSPATSPPSGLRISARRRWSGTAKRANPFTTRSSGRTDAPLNSASG